MIHIALDNVHTFCDRLVGENAVDSYTTDPLRATGWSIPPCAECLAVLEQPRRYYDVLSERERSYQQGYTEGKQKAYFEMQTWVPNSHDTGCGCEPCRTAGILVRKMLGGVDDGRAR